MKTIALKILGIIVSFSVSNKVVSNTVPDTAKAIPLQELKINRTEELQSFYNKGIFYYKMAEYLSIEDVQVDERTFLAFCRLKH